MAAETRRAMGSTSLSSWNRKASPDFATEISFLHIRRRRALGSGRLKWFPLAGDGLRHLTKSCSRSLMGVQSRAPWRTPCGPHGMHPRPAPI